MEYLKSLKFLLALFLIATFTVFKTASAETLTEAFISTLNTNPNLLESEATQEAAWQAFKQLHAGYFPTVGLEYQIGRGKGLSESPQTLNIGYTVRNIQRKAITLSQLIFDGGALSGRARSAMDKFESARWDNILVLNQLALRTTAAYLAVLRSKEMEQIARQNLGRHRWALGRVRERFRGGAGTLSEFSLAKGRLSEAELVWHKTQLELANAKAVYEKVVGHFPSERLYVPVEPTHCVPASLEEADRMANESNPDIHSKRELIESAKHELDASKAVLYYPNVSLQLKAFRDDNPNGIASKIISMQGYVAFNYNLSLGGADLANMRRANEVLCASLASLEIKRREISLAIEQTWHELEIAKRDIVTLRHRLASTREMVDAFGKELQLGKRSLLDVMNSENEFYNVKSALVDTKYKIKIDTYALLANAGQLANYFLYSNH